jgi:site-specific recombinase XerD
MKTKWAPLPPHPLTQLFEQAVASVTTSLGEASIRSYRATARLFLAYLSQHHPRIRSLDQLRRAHIVGWLSLLRAHPPRAAITRANYVIYLRRLLEELAWTQQLPTLAHLFSRDDVPVQERPLPRPLTHQQDQLIQQELRRRDDLLSNALLLLRHTGMRLGECIDLSFDCLHQLGPDQWAIHVPLGKLKTERWVPVDATVCQLVERIRSLRPATAPHNGRLFFFRPPGHVSQRRKLRATLREAAAAAGISARIVPHQLRHTYGTEMLRAGLRFPAVIQLLGHKSPDMTLHYLEITQQDLQREFHRARAHPRHLIPSPVIPVEPARAGLSNFVASLLTAQHVLQIDRRALADPAAQRLLDRLANRLSKILAQARTLLLTEK